MHKNDMSTWMHDITCQRGCTVHATREVPIRLGGPTRYTDLTDIPKRFSEQFTIEVWDTQQTPVDGGPYCPARDAVSETILSHGVWEPQETTVLLCCFERMPGGLLIDFGSQLGWFSTLATISEMSVIALDADADCVDLTYSNLLRNTPMLGSVGAYLERLGPDVVPFSLDEERMRLPTVAKIDVEGAEPYAVRKLQPLIDERWVQYILMEVSPVFHDGYGDLVVGLMEDGYRVYQMPPKRVPPHQITRLDDLEPFEMLGKPSLIKAKVDEVPQQDLLFVLGGIQ